MAAVKKKQAGARWRPACGRTGPDVSVEKIVHADTDRVDGEPAFVDVAGCGTAANGRRRERAGRVVEIEVEVFDPRGPVACEGPLDAATRRPADAAGVVRDREAGQWCRRGLGQLGAREVVP